MEARDEAERRTLRIVLGINAAMFLFEIGLGWLAQSTGLIADSLDMLADALVYAIACMRWGGLGRCNSVRRV
jgi:Co/Zn/Cd efflux system component